MDMPDRVAAGWFARRTLPAGPAPSRLAQIKANAGATVSVCLPALNEQETIGPICECVSGLVHEGAVDELIVMDSGSTDATAATARGAGARVVAAADVTGAGPEVLGKGDVLWRSLDVASGDIVVWLDSDVVNFGAHFVTGLVAPLLTDPGIVFVKGFYERPERDGFGGARVTEIAVRPLLGLLAPELSGFLQPLAGEIAARADVLRRTPLCTGYGVEIALLVDLWRVHGLDALAQADLGVRVHRTRPLSELGRMSFEVVHALLGRLAAAGRLGLEGDVGRTLVQFDSANAPTAWPLVALDRPALEPA